MRRRFREPAWRMTLTVVALTATVMALYVQLLGLRSRQEENRAAAARLEDALAESRTKLKAEILAELRAELAKEKSGPPEAAGQPVPDTVLRRLESGTNAGEALGPAADPTRAGRPLTTGGLNQRLNLLATEAEESDRALRRDLEELRLSTQNELEVSRRATGLILVALIPLVIDLLYSAWPKREGTSQD
jgi:hypothetical protein